MSDTPLTADELDILVRAGYTPAGGGVGPPPYLSFRHNGQIERNTRAEWREIIAHFPDFWSPASRAEIRAALVGLNESELRELLDTVLAIDDPALIVAGLRGSALGLAGRVEKAKGK